MAAAAGAPTPGLHGTVEIDGRLGIVYDRLAGPLHGDRLLREEPLPLVAELGRLHAEIHAASAPELQAYSRRVQHALPGLSRPVATVLERRLDELPDGDTLLHGDLHPWNVMWDGWRWVPIDWDAAMRGDPMADVARTWFLLVDSPVSEEVVAAGLAHRRHELAERYLAAYAAVGHLDEERLDAWRLPILAARTTEDIPEESDAIHRMLEEMVGKG